MYPSHAFLWALKELSDALSMVLVCHRYEVYHQPEANLCYLSFAHFYGIVGALKNCNPDVTHSILEQDRVRSFQDTPFHTSVLFDPDCYQQMRADVSFGMSYKQQRCSIIDGNTGLC